jgi:mono/diheme cytochrome c family protein
MLKMRRMSLPHLVASAILAQQSPVIAQPADGDPASGRQLATRLCSSCHRVLPMTLSDKADPPSFQSIADLPSTTGISLNVFLHSNHRNMPDLVASSAESTDLIAYILNESAKSLRFNRRVFQHNPPEVTVRSEPAFFNR